MVKTRETNSKIEYLYQKHIKNLKEEKTTPNEVVFHYTSSEGLLGILKTASLWLSDVKHLNDETENIYTFKLLKSLLQDEYIDDALKNELLQCCGDKCVLSLNCLPLKRHYTACFSLKNDLLPLWSYYTKTKDSTGYNIGFKKQKLLKCLRSYGNGGFVSGKVIYDENIQKEILKSALYDFNEFYQNHKDEDTVRYFMSFVSLAALFFKHPSFESEQEYRIVNTKKTNKLMKNEILASRICNGMFIPYLSCKFDKEIISEVGISPTQKQEIAVIGIQKLLEQLNYKDVNIFKSKIPLRY